MDDADHSREVVFAKRKPRVARLASQPQVFFQRPGEAEVDDVRPRNHHPPRGLLLEVQYVFNHDSFLAREMSALGAFEQDMAQLFFRVSQLLGAFATQAQDAKSQV